MCGVSDGGGRYLLHESIVGVCAVVLGLMLAWACGITVFPQAAFAEQAAAADSEADKLPDPEDVTLETDDGVTIEATYYGSLQGKNAVPIILLHGYKGDRRDFDELALYLQNLGHAVIAPDLRGHGDSTRLVRNGSTINLDSSRLRKDDIQAMSGLGGDVECVKRFLMRKNNAGELNIEKLCVIGADMGATVALYWAGRDWSLPLLPGRKQGQDVKALVLISPQWSFKGIPISVPLNLRPIERELSMMMIVGTGDSTSLSGAKRIHNTLKKYRTAPPADPKEAKDKQDLFFTTPDTILSGAKMLSEKSLNLNSKIATFIDWRLVRKKFAWTDRKSKLEAE